MTDQNEIKNGAAPRELNIGLVICALSLLTAFAIAFSGGSLAFAAVFGAVSLFGVGYFLGEPQEESGAVQNSHDGFPDQIGPTSDDLITDPAYSFLPSNIHGDELNKVRIRDDYD